jgi:hypothetical protein
MQWKQSLARHSPEINPAVKSENGKWTKRRKEKRKEKRKKKKKETISPTQLSSGQARAPPAPESLVFASDLVWTHQQAAGPLRQP